MKLIFCEYFPNEVKKLGAQRKREKEKGMWSGKCKVRKLWQDKGGKEKKIFKEVKLRKFSQAARSACSYSLFFRHIIHLFVDKMFILVDGFIFSLLMLVVLVYGFQISFMVFIFYFIFSLKHFLFLSFAPQLFSIFFLLFDFIYGIIPK